MGAERQVRWASVAVARPIRGVLTYAVPAWMADTLQIGHVVLVPLGRASETGYVVGFVDTPDFDPAKAKPIGRLLDPLPAFDEEQLAFFSWIAGYYLAPLGMVIRTAVPSEVRVRSVRVLDPTDEGVDALTDGVVEEPAATVLREVIHRPGLTRKGLLRRLAQVVDQGADKAVDALVRRGWAVWHDREMGGVKSRVATVGLVGSVDAALGRLPRAGSRMKALIKALASHGGPVDVAALVGEQGAHARASLKKMEEAGAVVFGERERLDVLEDVVAMGSAQPPALNAAQQAALAVLTAPDAQGGHLLFGVTGSGKTEVFLGAARAALDRGQQVCVLVPEIGLTPQLVGRFKARFGDGIAVLHSGLTATDRLAHWRRIRAGEAQVAIGARSALFAPFGNLGLIVVDEEHDDSYKQDDGVRYHARDLAVVLGTRRACPVILASATPSLESWHNATTGRYVMLRLPERATPRAVPTVELVDMTEVPKDAEGQRPVLAPVVVQALQDTFRVGGQAIVLYNRRGYATMVQCGSCGASYECPNCGISMTLHARAGVMACHYCGLKRSYSTTCPVCEAPEMQELGKGTERIEQALQEAFPQVSVGRMDADTTAVRGAHHRILDAFREGQTQLLVGTQIVAKGHDFPGVHTAVVVSADQGFRMPDFRAAERTYALLVQLAGRAGRGDVPGRVLVQTWAADHPALHDLDDVEAFLERERRQRKVLRYPPWARLALVSLDATHRGQVQGAASALGADLQRLARGYPGVGVLGPAAAAMPRLVGRWRMQLILRGLDVRPFRAFLAAAADRIDGAAGRGVRVSVDVDPRHLM